MSDRVFSGRDVADALASAAQALGLRPEGLRYVVLDPGTPGGLGLKPTLARVAVLLGKATAPMAAAPSAVSEPVATTPRAGSGEGLSSEAQGLASEAEAVVAALAAAAKADIRVRAVLSEEALSIEVTGPEVASFLLAPSEAPLADAIEHLLHGMFAPRLGARRLRVRFEGQKEQRDERLRIKARELIAAVLADGQPRTTDPLNAYERRQVHMVVAEQAGVITYSVGGGADRRVTIAPEKASLGGEIY